jgi:hypothetical protein
MITLSPVVGPQVLRALLLEARLRAAVDHLGDRVEHEVAEIGGVSGPLTSGDRSRLVQARRRPPASAP